MFIFLSVSNIVSTAANIGKDNNKSIAVISTDHTNKGIKYNFIPFILIVNIVLIKLILLNNELKPAKCKAIIAISTLLLFIPTKLLKLG